MDLESKVIIDEEPSIYKFLQKQNIQNLSKTLTGMILLKMPKRMVPFVSLRNTTWCMQEG
jgi:hypothetical protein